MAAQDDALIAEIVRQMEVNLKPGKFSFRNAAELLPDTPTVAETIFFRDRITLFQFIEEVRRAMLTRMNDPRARIPYTGTTEKLIESTLKRMVASSVSHNRRPKKEVTKTRPRLAHPGGIDHLKALSNLLVRNPELVQRLDANTALIFSNAVGGNSTDPLSRELGIYLRSLGIADHVMKAVDENLRRPLPMSHTEAMARAKQGEEERKRSIGIRQAPGPRPARKGSGRKRF